MSIKIGRYSFEGLFATTDAIIDRSGVYAVLSITENNAFLLDVGESANVQTRLNTHDRRICWEKNKKKGQIFYAIHYTYRLHKAGRLRVEQEIRRNHNPCCGCR